MKKNILVLFVLSITAACSNYQYQSQLCIEKNRIDVPYFSGTYKVVGQDGNFRVVSIPYYLKHLGTGVYETISNKGFETYIQEAQKVYTCQYEGKTFVETEAKYVDSENNTVKGFNSYLLAEESWGISLTPALFDSGDLTANNIPYSIVELSVASSGSMQFSRKYLVINNEQVVPESLAKHARSGSFSVRLTK